MTMGENKRKDKRKRSFLPLKVAIKELLHLLYLAIPKAIHPPPPRTFCDCDGSTPVLLQSHYSIKKASAALGFGTENLILLSTDERCALYSARTLRVW